MKLTLLFIFLFCATLLPAQHRDMRVSQHSYDTTSSSVPVKGKYTTSAHTFLPKDTSYHVSAFAAGVATIRHNGKFGFIDTAGNLLRNIGQTISIYPGCSFGMLSLQKSEEAFAGSWGLRMTMNSIPPEPFRGSYMIVDRQGTILVADNLFRPSDYNADVVTDFLEQNEHWPHRTAGGQLLYRFSGTKGQGLISANGTIVVGPGEYSSIGDFENGLAPMQKGNTAGYIDESGRVKIPAKYTSTGSFSERRAPVMMNGRCGFIDPSGNLVIPCVYPVATGFEKGHAMVTFPGQEYHSDGNRGYIDTAGNFIIPLVLGQYSSDGYTWDSMTYSRMKKKLAFESFPKPGAFAGYDAVQPFREGRAAALKNGNWGFIDSTGAERVPCKYALAGFFFNGRARVQVNGKWGYVDRNGKEVIAPDCESAADFDQGLACVKVMNRGYAMLDTNGKEVVPFGRFDRGMEIRNGLIKVHLSERNSVWGKWGWVDKTGKERIPCSYSQVYDFAQGGVAVVSTGHDSWGWIDTLGHAHMLYQNASNLIEGMAYVGRNRKYGFIDSTGKETIPCQYDNIWSFHKGFAMVGMNGKRGYIDKTGKEITPQIYDACGEFIDGIARVYRDGKWGLINTKGEEILACKYSSIDAFINGRARVSDGHKTFFIDSSGKPIN